MNSSRYDELMGTPPSFLLELARSKNAGITSEKKENLRLLMTNHMFARTLEQYVKDQKKMTEKKRVLELTGEQPSKKFKMDLGNSNDNNIKRDSIKNSGS